MSRWGKNIVVPLDSLCKEKENTNRPTVARSVGTVGKWGKMGFTSTRTYALSGLPAAVAAAAAAAAAASPAQSPASAAMDDDMSPTVPEPPKPKKFFKSRNAAPPEVIAQIIQQLPRTPTSPMGVDLAVASISGTSMQGREPIKLKIAKGNSAERKKKTPKKSLKPGKTSAATGELEENAVAKAVAEPKQKKKKEEKKLKPEAAPSRIISRARKTINYCEYDEDERMPTPSRDILIPKTKVAPVEVVPQTPPAETAVSSANDPEPVLPPPAAPPFPAMTTAAVLPPVCPASKTPEHPPIVLRISKGTSRLVSTDSEEHPTSSPQHDSAELMKSRQVSTAVEEVPAIAAITALPTTPKIIVKPPKPPSPEPPPPLLNENNEINYCTVKISPDKPPKERLKLIIKTDYIRNAVAKAAAAEKSAAAEAKLLCGDGCERPEKEKKQKSKKHKHPKHAAVEQLTPAHTGGSEFKTPSPHLALGNSGEHQQALVRTVISPPALSERDFDSQSSVLGSISSKGNSTPQPLAQAVQEESCVIHSRGSSVITSDLETSQHSSLVAPPSDIESRLESMMMDGDVSTQRATNLVEEPLQEDILAVLRGDESQACAAVEVKVNGTTEKEVENTVEQLEQEPSKRRITRGRARGTTKTTYDANDEEEPAPTQKTPNKTRGRKAAAVELQSQAAEEELTPTVGKRTTRRGVKKTEEAAAVSLAMLVDESNTRTTEKSTPTKCTEDEAPTPTSASPPAPAAARRGRPPRNAVNTNSLSNNNNNINKIAASLSAKAGAAEEAKTVATTATTLPVANSQPVQRSYGRKRKNQEVTQVLQPSVEDLEEHPTPAKLHNIGSPTTTAAASASYSPYSPQAQSQTPTLDLHDANSNSNSLTRPPSTTPSSPPRRDYKIKDKFKRTLTLDNQVNCNAVLASSPTAQLACDNAAGATASGAEEELQQQRGSVKLVISKKKGSIFKSRALVPAAQTEQSVAAKRHLYKHRWEANGGTGDDTNASPNAKDAAQASAVARTTADKVFDDFSEELSTVGGLANSRDNSSPAQGKFTRVIKANPQAAPSVDAAAAAEAPRNTVTRVRNVKTAHQIQEIGEYQEMDDDVAYILDALQPHNPTPTRCLSALQLATKCMIPAFRMHVRAHGVVTEFFKALSDANTDLSLGLCTSAIMYILSQEGLNMDLDRDSLELMINLLEAEGVAAPLDRANYERNRQKVRELCEEIKAQGKATHLNVDSITIGTLAMETLLSLTSKRAGEWFKEELRELGGLEHIIKTISECCRPLIECDSAVAWTQSLVDNMQTVARCMRVLENVTQMNEENQKYMLTYVQGAAVDTLCNLYCLCNRELMLHPNAETSSKDDPGNVVRELLIPLMKVLINLTHTFNPTNAMGAELLGQRADVIEISFQLLLTAPNYIPDRCVFELSILVLLFLINLSMYTIPNRALIMKAFAPAEYVEKCTPKGGVEQQSRMTTIQAVMEYFYKCEELARLVEKNTDAILESNDKNKKKQEEVDETVNNLLQKAGHHMEHTLKGSYAAILIGHLINDSEEYENLVRRHLRGNGFKEIVSVLEKYYTFMNLTASSEAAVVAHIKSTKKLIDYFKKRDSIYEMNAETNDSGLPLNLETHHALASGSSGSTSTPSTEIAHSSAAGVTTTTRSTTQRVYKTYSQR